MLKQITQYQGFGSQPTEHRSIVYFWAALAGFSQEQLAAYLRYVWGRSRLSHSFGDTHKLTYVNKQNMIPEAHTCFFELDLGDYSDEAELRRKLVYGMENCDMIVESSGQLNLGTDFGM